MENMMIITPDLARYYLAKSTLNRSVRRAHVRRLAADMAHGRWREDLCPPLILGYGDEVVDGQHRLHALIESGCSMSFEVRRIVERHGYGLPIDVGITRSPRDLLLRPAKVAQVINVCASIAAKSNAPLRDDLVVWERIIGDVAQRLQQRSGGDVRGMSTAPIRAGFCIASMTVASDMGEGLVFDLYADLKSARIEYSPLGSIGALYRRLLNTSERGYPGNILRCWFVIEAFRRRSAMVIRKLNSTAAMAEDLRSLLESMLDKGDQR